MSRSAVPKAHGTIACQGEDVPVSKALAAADEQVRGALAPTGVLRAAINLGNSVLAQRADAPGQLAGVSVELAEALARRLEVRAELVEFASAGQVVRALPGKAWDVAFLAVDPARGRDMVFTAPYLLIEGSFLVASGSPLADAMEVDRPGLRIATGQGSAYDLFLERSLRHARLVRHPVARDAFDALARGECEAAAGVRQVAERYAREHGAMRVLAPSFMAIEQAMAVPRSGLAPQVRDAVASYLTEFLREQLGSGCIAQALRRSGQHDVTPVPND